MQFSNEIRTGDILVLFGFLMAGFFAFTNLRQRLSVMEALHELRFVHIDATLEDAKHDLKNSNVQDSKIERLENQIVENTKLIHDLQRWRGFVNPDGEFDRAGRRVEFEPVKDKTRVG